MKIVQRLINYTVYKSCPRSKYKKVQTQLVLKYRPTAHMSFQKIFFLEAWWWSDPFYSMTTFKLIHSKFGHQTFFSETLKMIYQSIITLAYYKRGWEACTYTLSVWAKTVKSDAVLCNRFFYFVFCFCFNLIFIQHPVPPSYHGILNIPVMVIVFFLLQINFSKYCKNNVFKCMFNMAWAIRDRCLYHRHSELPG